MTAEQYIAFMLLLIVSGTVCAAGCLYEAEKEKEKERKKSEKEKRR